MSNKLKRKSMWLLGIILISYFVVGFPDGSFTISWIGISEDIAGMTTAHTGFILIAYSFTYTTAGIILSRLTHYMKLQTVYFWGLIIMGLGFIGLAFAPNFELVMTAIAVYGFGTGAMAASMNSYMAKHFTASQNNLMHFFWGGGAAISPIIMSRMMVNHSWRMGYFVITAILGVVAVILLISMSQKMWINDEHDEALAQATTETVTIKKKYLTKTWHQVVEILTFFFLGGTDYTLVFFMGAALIARGEETAISVGILSAVYYAAMTLGRLFFGIVAKWLRELPIIRTGIVIAILGLAVIYFVQINMVIRVPAITTLYFTSNIAGMALIGFGLGPLLPTLVSDTSNRFTPRVLSKLVGYELAAFGAGIAVLFFLTSQILHFVSYEALFHLGLIFIILVFVCNEVLAHALKKCSQDDN